MSFRKTSLVLVILETDNREAFSAQMKGKMGTSPLKMTWIDENLHGLNLFLATDISVTEIKESLERSRGFPLHFAIYLNNHVTEKPPHESRKNF